MIPIKRLLHCIASVLSSACSSPYYDWCTAITNTFIKSIVKYTSTNQIKNLFWKHCDIRLQWTDKLTGLTSLHLFASLPVILLSFWQLHSSKMGASCTQTCCGSLGKVHSQPVCRGDPWPGLALRGKPFRCHHSQLCLWSVCVCLNWNLIAHV